MAYPKSWTCPSCKRSIVNSAYCKNCAYKPNKWGKIRLSIPRSVIILVIIGLGLTFFGVLYFIGPIGGLCFPRWECAEWVTEEILGHSVEVRNCYDQWSCGSLLFKPIELKSDSLKIESVIRRGTEFIRMSDGIRIIQLKRDYSRKEINLTINDTITDVELNAISTYEGLAEHINTTCIDTLAAYVDNALVKDFDLKNMTLYIFRLDGLTMVSACQANNDTVMRRLVSGSEEYNLSYELFLVIFLDNIVYSIMSAEVSKPSQELNVNGAIIDFIDGDYSNIGSDNIEELRGIYDYCSASDTFCGLISSKSQSGLWSLVLFLEEFRIIMFDDGLQKYYICDINPEYVPVFDDPVPLCEQAVESS